MASKAASEPAGNHGSSAVLRIAGMTCASCVGGVERAIAARMEAIVVGDGRDPAVGMGPMA